MTTKTPTVLRQIAEIETLDLAALRERWRELYGAEPPGLSKALLVRRLAYRVQELAFGGVSPATLDTLRQHLDHDASPSAPVAPIVRRGQDPQAPVEGTIFVREWQGRRYEVLATDGGFTFEGRPYRSLSAVAKHITGQHLNGRAFFGLPSTSKRKGRKS